MLGYIGGLNPGRLDERTLFFSRGSVAKFDGSSTFRFPETVEIDLNTVGPRGLDTGKLQPETDYFVYALEETATTDVTLICSQSITYGGIAFPPGYVSFRKLPFGFVTDASANVRPFHCSHWPFPAITYTDTMDRCISAGAMPAWTKVSLTRWVPDNARLAWVHFVGNGKARTLSTDAGREFTGTTVLPMVLRSDRSFDYNSTGTCSAHVLRYEMTEPTT